MRPRSGESLPVLSSDTALPEHGPRSSASSPQKSVKRSGTTPEPGPTRKSGGTHNAKRPRLLPGKRTKTRTLLSCAVAHLLPVLGHGKASCRGKASGRTARAQLRSERDPSWERDEAGPEDGALLWLPRAVRGKTGERPAEGWASPGLHSVLANSNRGMASFPAVDVATLWRSVANGTDDAQELCWSNTTAFGLALAPAGEERSPTSGSRAAARTSLASMPSLPSPSRAAAPTLEGLGCCDIRSLS
mmetsp:Transcript_16622/g.35106  ORF Transcript_16622/g.35106 Transcript_16622/m.35106 type:complete len:246 (-) Transcript_16622:9-746(-)